MLCSKQSTKTCTISGRDIYFQLSSHACINCWIDYIVGRTMGQAQTWWKLSDGQVYQWESTHSFEWKHKAEVRGTYPLYLVSGIKPFPLWHVLVHNQEYRHCHWGGKHTQQPAKKRGARLLVYSAITHMCRQNNMANGKKYKVYLNLNYLFPLFFLTEITAIPRFSQSLQWEQAAWSLLLLRAPYLWNILFLQSRTTTF